MTNIYHSRSKFILITVTIPIISANIDESEMLTNETEFAIKYVKDKKAIINSLYYRHKPELRC